MGYISPQTEMKMYMEKRALKAEIERLQSALKQIMQLADKGVASEHVLNTIGHIADDAIGAGQG